MNTTIGPSDNCTEGDNVSCEAMAANMSQTDTTDLDIKQFIKFEAYVRIIVPIVFGLIVVLGLIGNSLVIFVILKNEQMRNTTNILILNLAIADLCFIIFCVPFTAVEYAFTQWPFRDAWCKIVQYTIYVCAYASVYTLVLMSLDRYLAVVHPIDSMSYRTQRNTIWIVITVWVIILGGHVPLLFQNDVVSYEFNGEQRTMCMLTSHYYAKVYFGSFFAFGYVLPLSLTCILYVFMLKRLLYGVVPGGSQSAESIRFKKRVTKMVVSVVIVFAVCWLPIQIVLMFGQYGSFDDSVTYAVILMVSRCLAYMNSCLNPILYAFLSENFRQSFRKILNCGYGLFAKSEYERRNVNIEKTKRTTIPPQASEHHGPSTSPSTSAGIYTMSLHTHYNEGVHNQYTVNHCTQTHL